VLTFGPDGMTFHDDHIAVGRWTTLAFRQAAVPDMQLLYATKTRDWLDAFSAGVDSDRVMMIEGAEPPWTDPEDIVVHFTLDDGQLDRKVRALKAQASQVGTLLDQIGDEAFDEFNRDEFYRLPTANDWP
jgi:LmbE family N-acetylglucosaminyl deacetylase